MTDRGHTNMIYGSYVEHVGRFCQGVAYHPLDRNKHHIFEFEEKYAVKTEISAEAHIMLGAKVIDRLHCSNDFYGVCTSVREVASKVPALLKDYVGATVTIVATIAQEYVILAPAKEDRRREGCSVPNDWWLAEDKDKLDAMLNSGRPTCTAEEFPRRLEKPEPEEMVLWSSATPKDFTALVAFANSHNLSSEKLDDIMRPLL